MTNEQVLGVSVIHTQTAAVDDFDHVPQPDTARAHDTTKCVARITYIEPDGNPVTLAVTDGWSLMKGATVQGVAGIEAECGGSCACATCHCYVSEAWLSRLPPPGPNELLILENTAAERRPNSRLSCQIQVTPELDGLTVAFPDRQS